MADIQKTVEILFTATDKTSAGIRNVNQNLQDIASPLANLTKGFLKLEAALLAIGVAFGVKAFNDAAKFEGALLDLQKVMNDSEGDAAAYTDTVDALSAKYGESGAEILQGAANIKQAGFTVKESFELQDIALKASVIGEQDLNAATQQLIATLNGFKAPASEATRLLDVQNEVSNNHATTLEQLSLGMSRLSPIAHKMGFSFEETAAILTPVIEVFRNGGEASNALKIGLVSLIDDSGPVKEALNQIGVSQKNLDGSMRSGKEILYDVAQAFTTLEQNQKLVVTSMIVGERQAARMSEVFDGLGKINEVLATATNSVGSANKELEIRLASTEVQVKRASAAFNLLSKTIGEQFRVELTEVIRGVTGLEIALAEIAAGGGFEDLMKLVRPQLEEWAALLVKMTEALPEAIKGLDFSPLIDAFKNVGDTLSDNFGDFDLGTVEGLRDAIQSVIDGLADMINITDGIAQGFLAMAGPIISIIKWFGSLDSDTQKLLGNLGAMAVGVTALSPIIMAFAGVMGLLGTGAIAGLVGAIGGLVGLLVGPVGLLAAFTALAGVGLMKLFGDDTRSIEENTVALESAVSARVKLTEEQLKVRDAMALASKEVDTWTEKLRTMSDLQSDPSVNQETMVEQWNLWTKAVESGSKTAEEGAVAIAFLAKGLDNMTFKVLDSKQATEDYNQAIRDRLILEKEQIQTLISAGATTEEINKARAVATKTQLELNHSLQTGVQAANEAAEADKKSKEAMEKKVGALVKYKLGLEEIQSKERISTFKITSEIDIADIEANKEKILAAFTSVDTGMTSTGETLVGLFGQFGEAAKGAFGTSTITKAVEKESDLRKQEFELQQKLVNTQIEHQEKLTEAIGQEEIIINVNGDGLKPHLEAIMWEILDTVQVRANSEGSEYLLGLAGGGEL